MIIMLLSTQEPYVSRKELSQSLMDGIRTLSLSYAISGDDEPIYGSLMPDDNKNYSAYVDYRLEVEANKYKE